MTKAWNLTLEELRAHPNPIRVTGIRFRFEDLFTLEDRPSGIPWRDNAVRVGVGGTFVIEARPIAGPIDLFVFHTPGQDDHHCHAVCQGCDESSPTYSLPKRRAAMQWGHRHRCDPERRML